MNTDFWRAGVPFRTEGVRSEVLKKFAVTGRFVCVNFRFDITKATEAGCQFLKRERGSMNIMKLVKLIYLLDRLSVARRGRACAW